MQRFIWAICWCLTIVVSWSGMAGTQVLAQEPVETSKPVDWQSVLNTLPTWKSGESPESFHFELHVTSEMVAPGSVGSMRVILDHAAHNDALLFFAGHDPLMVHTGDNIYCYKDMKWSAFTGQWSFELSERHREVWMRSKAAESGPVILDLLGYLAKWCGETPERTWHNPVTNSHVAVFPEHYWVEIRRRSPNDETQLGTDLSEVLVVPNRVDRFIDHGRMSIRSFTTLNRNGLRLSHDRGAIDRKLFRPKTDDKQNTSEQPAGLGWDAVLPRNPRDQLIAIRLYEQTVHATEAIGQNHLMPNAGLDELRQSVTDVVSQVRILQGQCLAPDANQQALWFDDPTIRWRYFEGIGRGSLQLVCEKFVLLVSQSRIPADLKMSYLDAVADFGTPITPMECILSRKYLTRLFPGQEQFIETIFRSRHMYHVEPDEIDATVAALVDSKPSSEMERVAVETLLRLDEYDRVPPDRWQRWWDKEVVKADKVFRWDTLSMLSLHPGNRAVLMAQLPKASAPLNHEIWKNLKLRAESTVRTKRWDFMTEAECQKILALPAPPTPGKDTEGGAARPFPKEE